MINERTYNDILEEVRLARKRNTNLRYTSDELAIDLLIASKQFVVYVETYLKKGQKVSAKRIRTASKVLETLGKSFRVESVKSL